MIPGNAYAGADGPGAQGGSFADQGLDVKANRWFGFTRSP
jgi:hypothetical protein